jgi:hypothetical protein
VLALEDVDSLQRVDVPEMDFRVVTSLSRSDQSALGDYQRGDLVLMFYVVLLLVELLIQNNDYLCTNVKQLLACAFLRFAKVKDSLLVMVTKAFDNFSTVDTEDPVGLYCQSSDQVLVRNTVIEVAGERSDPLLLGEMHLVKRV